MIYLFVHLLFVAGVIFAMEPKVRPLEIGTSGTIRCDHIEDGPLVRLVHWYEIRINGESKSLAWWTKGESGSLPNYHMDNTTFALVIDKVMSEDEGLYQCSVVRGDLLRETSYYTRTVMYTLPPMDPEITEDTESNRVNCTVEHVKPLVYPVVNFEGSPDYTETYAVMHEDGTHTTSVSCTLPHINSAIQVHCSFSYLHYRREASKDLRNITSDSPMEEKTTTVSPMSTSVTFAGDGPNTMDNTAIIVAPIFICFLTVSNLILITMWKKDRRRWQQVVQKSNKAKESVEDMI